MTTKFYFCQNEAIATEAIKKALLNNQPDGIFSSVERYTLILYALCNELNIIIPDQLKVISFFNSTMAPLLAPPLSSISHPALQMGKAAVEFLFQKLKKRQSSRKRILYSIALFITENQVNKGLDYKTRTFFPVVK